MKTKNYARSVSQRVNRRRFTLGIGAGLIAAPFVKFLRANDAHAAGGSAQRLIVIATHGTDAKSYRLNGASPDSLVFNDWNSGLEAVKGDLVFIEGLNGGAGHDSYHCLTGETWTNKTSVDQRIADCFAGEEGAPGLPSLLLGAEVPDGTAHFVRSTRLPVINDVATSHSLVFSGVAPAGASEAEQMELIRRKQSVLDTVKGDLNDLQAMLGAEQRPKLEKHLESIRQYENRLAGGGSGSSCEAPASIETKDSIQTALAQMEIARLALACDVTRVVGLQWGEGNGFNVNVPEIGFNAELHYIEHEPAADKRELHKNYEAWFSRQFAALVQAVKDTSDPVTGGSLLDTTLIAWVREMGDSIVHANDDQRIVLAGGPSILNTTPNGRYVDVAGESYTRGLLTMMNPFGVTELDDFGDRNASRDPLPNVLAP